MTVSLMLGDGLRRGPVKLGSKLRIYRLRRGRGVFLPLRRGRIGVGRLRSGFEESHLSVSAIDGGFATKEEIEETVHALREWIDNDDGWFGLLHGQIVAKV